MGNTQITKREKNQLKLISMEVKMQKPLTIQVANTMCVCVMTNSIYKKQTESTNRFQTLTLMSAFFSIT